MEEGYPRNRVIIEGLRSNGAEVIECHEEFWRDSAEKLEGVNAWHLMLKIPFRLLLIYGKLINKFMQVGYYDALIVGYAGHIDIFLAKLLNLFRRKPVIFDAFLSLYDTAVMDRRIVPSNSLKAKLLRLVDTWSCRVADAILLDTQAHIDYFVREFRLPASIFFAVPVGSYLSPHPASSPQGGEGQYQCEVLYFGSYIPLHGVDTILKAASMLQDEKALVFTLIGKGQLLPEMKRLASDLGLKNINFIDRFMKEEELTRYIEQADICLGIFGETDKALRVIPCKVYNCLVMGKPLITAQTPAIEGVLTHMENAFLCKPGDPEALYRAIRHLKNDGRLRKKLSNNGKEYFRRNFSIEAIGKRVVHIIENLQDI